MVTPRVVALAGVVVLASCTGGGDLSTGVNATEPSPVAESGTNSGSGVPEATTPPEATAAPTSTAAGTTVAPGGQLDDGVAEGGARRDVASVYADATFEVEVTTDVVYAQGLTHSAWGSDDAAPVDLLLDVYQPVRPDDAAMPAVVMIHGGGFVSGNKEHGPLSRMAYWFAERGWVAFSINYRLARDVGTLPADYPRVPATATARQQEQWNALYPACRDAKAAIRWVRSSADEYSVQVDHISAVGGSAGSFLAVALGASDEADCRDEITTVDDPTLASAHLEESSAVATVIDHWGGASVVTMLEALGGGERFDASDAPISIVHGTEDGTVSFSQAEELRAAYEQSGVSYAWHPLVGEGHGAWNATIDERPLVESAASFIIAEQQLDTR